ncbi:hypothetical protein BWQ96_06144 [Gracilariopsis chorda]|uniref:BZIP domain-containing protein n=1 Tax=Gracilariopsis chorda TaxID=448386 RepID=A0A2V3IPS5_9FLOR|nr:hypothetical protein BWQ96_06144 [Gracilariopsis chorda]|eukprot:PXF44063.1 hypothetical protein BWQ96_06144 [Gracilariopsis chorda]
MQPPPNPAPTDDGDSDSSQQLHGSDIPSAATPSSSGLSIVQTSISAPLPTTTRGAPEELKPAIRKLQNRKSAQRSRRRRSVLLNSLPNRIDTVLERVHRLESRVARIERFLHDRFDFEIMTEQVADEERFGDDDDDGGAPGGNDVESGEDMDDDLVEQLIDRCVSQS